MRADVVRTGYAGATSMASKADSGFPNETVNTMAPPNASINADAPRRHCAPSLVAPVSSRPEMVCQLFFVGAIIEASSGEPRRLSALR
jgi:hypothetical protein